jgi:uncharacterized protein
MAKPHGPICNLSCQYCYYLSKEHLYPDSDFRMSYNLLESFTRQYIEAQPVPAVAFGWQGGEPLLAGLEFFRRAVDLQERYRRPGMRITNALQTNGVLLDDRWCEFFHDHDFLVGLSLDGPGDLHNVYRVDKRGRPTFDRVMDGLLLLREHSVEFNTLTCVHAGNADRPLDVYQFLRDEVEASFVQFIPIVERKNHEGIRASQGVTNRSVGAEEYGDFLIAVFDEWVTNDVGEVSVQIFDAMLSVCLDRPAGLCVFDPVCGRALVLEHNGDLYSCDHFVEPRHKLGNILEKPLGKLAALRQQTRFGKAKRGKLPDRCRGCEVLFVCNGGCPKNRVFPNEGGLNINYLCEGYQAFFAHAERPMRLLATAIKMGRPTSVVQEILAEEKGCA